MPYETGTVTSVGDIMVKWFTFLKANGWTADEDYTVAEGSPNYGIISRKVPTSPLNGNATVNLQCSYVQVDTTNMYMNPMLGYTSGGVAGREGGATTGEMPHNYGSIPNGTYWFFSGDYYAHAVIEYATGFFRHFGMGQMTKAGDYFGGEYYYSHYVDQSTTYIDNPDSAQHRWLWDYNQNVAADASCYLHMQPNYGEPVPGVFGQSPATRWYVMKNTAAPGNDNDGVERGRMFADGVRYSMSYPIYYLGQIPYNGYRPLHPCNFYLYDTVPAPDTFYPVGTLPDIRYMSMQGNLLAGDEFTVGADTWKVFPLVRKRDSVVSDNTEQSRLFGLAFKK